MTDPPTAKSTPFHRQPIERNFKDNSHFPQCKLRKVFNYFNTNVLYAEEVSMNWTRRGSVTEL